MLPQVQDDSRLEVILRLRRYLIRLSPPSPWHHQTFPYLYERIFRYVMYKDFCYDNHRLLETVIEKFRFRRWTMARKLTRYSEGNTIAEYGTHVVYRDAVIYAGILPSRTLDPKIRPRSGFVAEWHSVFEPFVLRLWITWNDERDVVSFKTSEISNSASTLICS